MGFPQTVSVEAAKNDWHSGVSLNPGKSYILIPSDTETVSIDNGISTNDFHGISWMNGEAIAIPAHVRIGGLVAVVWHDRGGRPVPEILTFPPGVGYGACSINEGGGSIYFQVADLGTAYADNKGKFTIDIFETDDQHVKLMVHVYKSYYMLDTLQFLHVCTRCGINVAAGALGGAARGGGLAGAIIWGGVSAVSTDQCWDCASKCVEATRNELGNRSSSGSGVSGGTSRGGGERARPTPSPGPQGRTVVGPLTGREGGDDN